MNGSTPGCKSPLDNLTFSDGVDRLAKAIESLKPVEDSKASAVLMDIINLRAALASLIRAAKQVQRPGGLDALEEAIQVAEKAFL